MSFATHGRPARRLFAAALAAAIAWLSALPPARAQEGVTEATALAVAAQELAAGIAPAVARGEPLETVTASALRAIETAEQALALDPALVEAHLAIAQVHRQFWRWSAARRAYEAAYAVAPNDPAVLFNYGWFNSFSGRHPQAIAMAERAVRLAPTAATAQRDLGIAHAYAGNPEPAAAALGRCTALDPDALVCHIWLSFMLGRLGRIEEAAAELAAAERLAAQAMSPAAASSIAHGYSRIGRGDDAARLFARLERMAGERAVGAGSWPLAYLAVGDAQQAFQWLERAVAKIERREPDEGFFNLMIIKANVLANPVLDEARFVALRERIGAF
ncbi:MAG TPA: hypothetical protein VF322_06765 [Gammaproteobacteria bacterium]